MNNDVNSYTPPPPYNPEIDDDGFEDASGIELVGVVVNSKIKNFCKCIFSATTFKVFAGIVGTAAIVVGSLAAKGIIVLGSAAASLLAAKILIPVGCVILVVLLAKLIFDAVKH